MFLIINSYYLNDLETDDVRQKCFSTLEEAQEAIKTTPPRYYDEYTIRDGEASLIVEVKDVVLQNVEHQVTWDSKSITVEELKEYREKLRREQMADFEDATSSCKEE